MCWTTARVAAYFISLALGIAVTSVLAQHYTGASVVRNRERVGQAVRDSEQSAPLQQDDNAQFAASFEPVEVISSGYTNSKIIALRESPRADATVIAVLKQMEHEYVEILDATRDYLRVRLLAKNAPPDDKDREKDREGWVVWGEVVPGASAIVLDAETRDVVSRLPFSDNEHSPLSVSFASDNSRAIFYGGNQAYEVRTEDYTLMRSFRAEVNTGASFDASFFYGSTDDVLYAAFHSTYQSQLARANMLNILRVHGAKESPAAPDIYESSTGFALSADGRTGFILHPVRSTKGEMEDEMLVDVLNLRGMRVSNTLKLRGERLPTSASEFITNADGSELYFTLFPSREVISVIETKTGHLLREIPTASLKETAQYLSRDEMVGDAWLFRVWGDEEADSYSVWLDGGKASRAQRGIDRAVEAGGVRWAVNDSGTRLFKLGADNRISERLWIDRPEVRLDPGNTESLGVYHLFASPDGKRIILIIGALDRC